VTTTEWQGHICPFFRHVCVRELALHGVKAPFREADFIQGGSDDVFTTYLAILRNDQSGADQGRSIGPRSGVGAIHPSVAAYLDAELRTLTDYCINIAAACLKEY
jgi:hypothetical protein